MAIALMLALTVFLSEPLKVDFFQKGHLNWVSLDSLAIANHSSFNHGGVGYGCEEMDGVEGNHFHYFNRYPMFFAVLSRLVLQPFWGDAVAWLYAARQWMNVIFIGTGLVLWWLLRTLHFSRVVATASVLITLSAPVVLQYRSMFHFDQPALLAYGLLLVVVVRKLLCPDPSLRWYLGTLFVAAMTGRSAAVLIFSLVLPVVLTSWKPSAAAGEPELKARTIFGVWAGVPLAFGSVGVATAYNVVWEARLNQVPWQSTTVVQSALRRLGFTEIPGRLVERTRWLGGAIPKISAYLLEYFYPLLIVAALLIVIRLMAFRFQHRTRFHDGNPADRLGPDRDPSRRLIVWSVGMTSLLWVVVMKNLFVFHIYAGMMLLPFVALVLAFTLEALMAQLNGLGVVTPRLMDRGLVLASCSLFLVVLVFGPGAQMRPSAARELKLRNFFAEFNVYRQGLSAGD